MLVVHHLNDSRSQRVLWLLEELAVPYDIPSMRPAGTWPHKGVLVRFSLGLEAISDLRADLEQALSVLA